MTDLLAIAVDVAREAGALLRERAGTAHLAGTKSSPTDAVTEVDRASEQLILSRIRTARPDDSVLGEEGASIEGTTGLRWVVDPLDGTVNYLYEHPTGWSISLAVEDEAGPLAGVVYDPARDETFTAARGRGALCNGRPITVSACSAAKDALIGTGFSYQSSRREEQARLLVGVLPRIRDIRRAGSAALDLCWVACGRLDGFYEMMLGPWDYAAGSLIVREAGGRFGKEANGLVVAASPALFDELVRLVS